MDAHETTCAATKKRNQQSQRQRREFNPKTHSLNKRPVSKPFQRKGDIYVTNKSNFQAQIKQCLETLETEATGEIYLHCLGNAIKRGITLALKLVQESDNGLGYEANTSTIDLTDDLHPLNDEEDFSIQKRKNSCLHIRIFRHSNNLSNKKPQT
ncbi:ribonuclease P protein subunit p20 [Contarinia nasturtii]|uniref:ribonuclease P protein subunit p20 n=1 Tax=Contarinia nasturtii TaxID=265458 RepID=UPI0012D48BE3|nr:ribonuclease P protein subunit p20 [Contarinia nasturtii]